ncbi:3D domain-containing protein [Effusibacillus pohliae]|uniref:3D domain-containing protein n=1 Tax=Effusibacillus pohliae TaxID=232270 RepID=UPI00037AEAAB|nr:3D domain-containing protein [Effusibacillus pohliae]
MMLTLKKASACAAIVSALIGGGWMAKEAVHGKADSGKSTVEAQQSQPQPPATLQSAEESKQNEPETAAQSAVLASRSGAPAARAYANGASATGGNGSASAAAQGGSGMAANTVREGDTGNPAAVQAQQSPAIGQKPAVTAGQTLTMRATAYGPTESSGQFGGKTYLGTPVRQGVIAVDPKVIPLGTRVWVSGYHHPNLPANGFMAVAEDIGGAIRGNRIDIYINADAQSVRDFGIQTVQVRILK